MNKSPKLGNRLALTTALAGILLSSYGGRSAYAGSCVGAAGTYACSGAANVADTTQSLIFAGALTVTTNAGFGIDTSSTGGTAIIIEHDGGSGDLAFTDANSAAITGSSTGIYANNTGDNALNISTTGAVTGNTRVGIDAYNSGSSTDLTINAQGSVSGYSVAVGAFNAGGSTTITTTGSILATNLHGIAAFNYYNTGDMTVDAQGTVTGQRNGIITVSLGDGETTITTTAAVIGTNEIGITATLGKYSNGDPAALSSFKFSGKGAGNQIQGGHPIPPSYGTNLSINSQAAVTGGESGIYAYSTGSGFVSITTTAAVTGTNNVGIVAISFAGTDLTIDASDTVTGGDVGIVGVNLGSGATTITTTAAVAGNNSEGIYAYNSYATTDLTIDASGTVTGYQTGIDAINLGSGATTITTTGVVAGTNFYGIFARNFSNATDLRIDTHAAVSGYAGGIGARNAGSGNTSITTAGVVVAGISNHGINAHNFSSATDLLIDTQAFVYGVNGITAYNGGTGMTTINISGNVVGMTNGLTAQHNGSGVLQITTSAAITGGSDYAINTETGLGNNSIIDLNAGTVVSAASTMGIQNDAGDSAITVATGASIIGSISLGDGSDDLTFSGGDFTAVTTFDGGDDTDVADTFIDTLTFAGSSGLLVAADVINWENIVIEAASTVTFDGIENLITPSLSNAGRINTQDGAVGDSLSLSGDFTGGGTLSLDTVADDGSGGSDVFVVQGNLTSGTTMLNIANIGGAGGQTVGNGILLVQVAGSSPIGSFSMVPFTVGGFDYQLVQVGLDWYLQSTLLTYPITEIANPIAGGSVSCAPNPVGYGSSASCTATANTGYTFVDWSGDCTGAGACDLTNVTAVQGVTATFALNSYPITEIANPLAGGSVSCTPNPVGYDGSASCSATANAGYAFVDWSGDCTGAGACELTNVTADQSVTATFTGIILEPVDIPTIGQWGTGLLAFLLGGMGWHRLRRRAG